MPEQPNWVDTVSTVSCVLLTRMTSRPLTEQSVVLEQMFKQATADTSTLLTSPSAFQYSHLHC